MFAQEPRIGNGVLAARLAKRFLQREHLAVIAQAEIDQPHPRSIDKR
jgi:hypothetical protein